MEGWSGAPEDINVPSLVLNSAGSAWIRVHSWESGASMTHLKSAGIMGCLILEGEEQKELGQALDELSRQVGGS